jgi:hypothetical protein
MENTELSVIKPERACKITINGVIMEYPEPVRGDLEFGREYYCIDPSFKIIKYEWNNDNWDINALKNGLIHSTEQAAQQHLSVLRAVNAQAAV